MTRNKHDIQWEALENHNLGIALTKTLWTKYPWSMKQMYI